MKTHFIYCTLYMVSIEHRKLILCFIKSCNLVTKVKGSRLSDNSVYKKYCYCVWFTAVSDIVWQVSVVIITTESRAATSATTTSTFTSLNGRHHRSFWRWVFPANHRTDIDNQTKTTKGQHMHTYTLCLKKIHVTSTITWTVSVRL